MKTRFSIVTLSAWLTTAVLACTEGNPNPDQNCHCQPPERTSCLNRCVLNYECTIESYCRDLLCLQYAALVEGYCYANCCFLQGDCW